MPGRFGRSADGLSGNEGSVVGLFGLGREATGRLGCDGIVAGRLGCGSFVAATFAGAGRGGIWAAIGSASNEKTATSDASDFSLKTLLSTMPLSHPL